MTDKTKLRMVAAAENAAEMIRSHVEVGLEPEDVNEVDEKGLKEYQKACNRVALMLADIANKYRV